MRQVIESPRNAAIKEYKGRLYPGDWEAIIDEPTWRAVVATLTERKRRFTAPHAGGLEP